MLLSKRTPRAGFVKHRGRRAGLRTALGAALVAGSMAIVLTTATAANAATLTPVVQNQPGVVDVAFDAAGNLYFSTNTGAVDVLPDTTGTLFGTSVTAGVVSPLETTLKNVPGIAFDPAGNLYMTDTDAGTVSVLSATGGTLFGTPVAPDTVTTLLSGLIGPVGIAFDPAGNLYVVNNGGVSVYPKTSGTIFGQPVSVGALTTVASGFSFPAFLAFDPAGNLYISDYDGSTVSVLPAASGAVFGQPVTANIVTTLLSGLQNPGGISVDSSGNLYIAEYNNTAVLPASTGTLYGMPVTADTLTDLTTGGLGEFGTAIHNGTLYVADQGDSSVDEMGTPTATITGVSFGGSVGGSRSGGLRDRVQHQPTYRGPRLLGHRRRLPRREHLFRGQHWRVGGGDAWRLHRARDDGTDPNGSHVHHGKLLLRQLHAQLR